MKKRLLFRFLICAIVVTGFHQRNDVQGKATTPNVILILTDDMGYGDLECYGGFPYHTPNINKLANQGMWFTNFYVSLAVWSPSRSSFLTGCYPIGSRVLYNKGIDIRIKSTMLTLSVVLQDWERGNQSAQSVERKNGYCFV